MIVQERRCKSIRQTSVRRELFASWYGLSIEGATCARTYKPLRVYVFAQAGIHHILRSERHNIPRRSESCRGPRASRAPGRTLDDTVRAREPSTRVSHYTDKTDRERGQSKADPERHPEQPIAAAWQAPEKPNQNVVRRSVWSSSLRPPCCVSAPGRILGKGGELPPKARTCEDAIQEPPHSSTCRRRLVSWLFELPLPASRAIPRDIHAIHSRPFLLGTLRVLLNHRVSLSCPQGEKYSHAPIWE